MKHKRYKKNCLIFVALFSLFSLITPIYADQNSKSVIVFLKNQPFFELAKQGKERYENEIVNYEKQIQGIHQDYLKREPLKEDKDMPYELTPVDKRAVDFASTRIQLLIQDMRQEIVRRTENAVAVDQRILSRNIQELGGKVNYNYIVFNAMAALVPEDKITDLKNNPLVDRVEYDYMMDGHLNTSTHSMKVDTFWQNNYTGGPNVGPWCAVIDCGIDWAHPALSSHSHKDSVFHQRAKIESNYWDNSSSTNDLQGHGTFVSGTIWSQGCNTDSNWTTYKGIAYNDNHCINAKAGYRGYDGNSHMFWSDAMKATEWAINHGGVWAHVANLSYGGSTNNDDTYFSRFWDAVVDDELVCATISAGNDGSGTDKINNPGIAFNAITVGAMVDCEDSTRSNDYIAGYSSRGPTPVGRKKPDLVAVGGDATYDLQSCNHAWETQSDFKDWTGTSFSAPQVAGAIILLGQLFGYNPNPKVAKAVLINTSEDLGSTGWNNDYGWGYLDLKECYIHRWDWFRHKIKPCSSKLYVGKMYSGDKATLVWNRHANYVPNDTPTVYYNLNNLDLKVFRKSDDSLLYSSTSTLDNVEQVSAVADSDSVVIKVEAGSSFSGVNQEEYALATEEGFTGPSYVKQLNMIRFLPPSPGNIYAIGAPIGVQKMVYNVSSGLSTFQNTCSLSATPGISIISGANPQILGTIPAGDSAAAFWIIDATAPGAHVVTVKDSSFSYGIPLVYSVTETIRIGNGAAAGKVAGNPGTQVVVPLATVNFDMLRGLTIPLEYDTTPLNVDSVRVDMAQFPAGWIPNVTVNEANGTILISVNGPPTGPYLSSGTRTIANIFFSIISSATSQIVTVDTCVIGTNVFSFIRSDGLLLNPVFGPGSVEILDIVSPNVPTLLAPANASLIPECQPLFVWSSTAGAGGCYDLQFDEDNGFSNPVTITTSDSTCQVPDTLSLSDTTYYWRVRAIDAAENPSSYSLTFSFTVDATAPEAPTLIAPADSSTITTNPPTFEWSEVFAISRANSNVEAKPVDAPTTPVTYTLQYSTDPDFHNNLVTISGLNNNSYTPPTELSAGTYFWRVEALDQAGNRSGYIGLPFSFIVPGVSSGWLAMAQIPTAPSGKKPKSGSCMQGLEATGLIYFLKASNRGDFYSYEPDPMGPGTWLALDTMPKGEKGIDYSDGKYPKRGAAMAAYEPGKRVYVVRGNNRLGFWKYQCDTLEDTLPGWYKLATIPAGAKRCKYGTGLTHVTKGGKDMLFLLKGAKTNEAYLYDIESNTWSPVTSVPTGMSGKTGYKKGSCIAYDGSEYVYILQGYYGSFFKYRVEADSFYELKWYDYKTYRNRDGRKKKPKDGASLVWYDNNIYMLKGGNTVEIWKYDIAANDWVQMDPANVWDIPLGPTGRKKVKDGGGMIHFGDFFWASKGKNTPEFYRHVLPLPVAYTIPKPTNEGIMGSTVKTDGFKLTIAPNPVIYLTTIKYNLPLAGPVTFKLYNITGALVKSHTITNPTKDGILTLDAKALPAGVYLLRFNSGEIRVTRKLVFEK